VGDGPYKGLEGNNDHRGTGRGKYCKVSYEESFGPNVKATK
jgi:hypothetical protein